MILSKLAVASLLLAVATGPDVEAVGPHLSLQQKNAAAQPFVRSATDCIVTRVMEDVRFRRDDPGAKLGDLIVDAMPNCLTPVHAMIDVYDRYFGEGAGQEFFMGPYLDVLPNLLLKRIKAGAE